MRKLAPLVGKVVDAQGKPVAGIAIYIDSRLPELTTRSDGTFAYKHAPTDRAGMVLAISPSLGGKADYQAGQAEVTITALPRQPRVCYADNGEGAPAANLSFTYAPATGGADNSSFFSLNGTAVTDAQGKCSLSLVPQVPYQFSWAGENDKNRDYSDGTALVTVNTDPKEPLKFTARQYLNALFIKFQNSKGEPVADVRPQFSNMEIFAADQRNDLYNLKSDKDGMIQFNRLAKGTLQFQAYAGRGNYRQTRFAIATDEAEVTCVLHRQDEPAVYSVRVVDRAGQLVPRIKLILYTQKQGKLEPQEYATDEKGVFQVPADVAQSSKQSRMVVFCDDPQKGWGGIQLQSHEDGMVELRLHQPGQPLQLQFVDVQKKPVVGAKIRISALGGLPGEPNTSYQPMPTLLPDDLQTSYGILQVTDEDGRVSFPRVDARLMGTLQVESAEFGSQSKPLPGPAGSSLIEMVKLSQLHGTLMLKDLPQAKLNNARVNLRNERTGLSTSLNLDGNYSFEQLQPDEYTITVRLDDPTLQQYKLPQAVKVKLAPGEEKTLDLQLEPGIPIRGKFIGLINGKRPRIALQDNEMGGINPTPVKEDGSFEFWVGEPGEYLIYYESPENSYQTLPDPIKVKDRKPVEGLELQAPRSTHTAATRP